MTGETKPELYQNELLIERLDSDVAQRKAAASEPYFRQLTDTIPAVIWETRPDGYCTYLNRHWYDLTGQTPEQAEGFGWLDATHPDDGAEAGRLFVEANQNQTSFIALYRLRHKDGSYRWVIDKGSPHFGANGTYEGMIGTVVDIHDQKIAEQTLRESEQRFQAAIAAVQGILWTNNAIGQMEGEQAGWAALTGQPYDEYQGFGWADAVHPDDAQPTIDAWQEALARRGTFIFEHRVRVKSGQWEPFSIRAIPLLNPDGTIREWVGVHTNVTEQRNAEEALRTSEAQLQSIITNAPVATGLLVGREMVIEVANETLIDYWGKGASVIGKPLAEALPELKNQPFLQQLDDVFTTGNTYKAQAARADLVVNGELGTYYFDYTFKPLCNADGQVYAILETAVDVTAQVLARQKIEASERQFRTLLETIPQMTWTNTPTGEVDFYNQRWYEYTGLSFEQTQNWGWQAVVHPDDFARTLANYQYALKTGEDFVVENRYKRADGAYRWHLSRAKPMYSEAQDGQLPDGWPRRITQWVGTATDIQQQKEQEAELDQQVQARTRQLQASVQDLERSNQNLQQFAYVASHDLQEPLRKIQSFGDILKSQYDAQLGDGVDYLNRMQAASGRMSGLIKDLLAYSRISTQQNATASVSLDSVVGAVLIDLELIIQETGAVVIVEPLPTVAGDRSQLGQLFQNLLSNALKFRRAGITPTIRVSHRLVAAADLPPSIKPTRHADHYHGVSVADNGIGFDEKYVDRIFQVFQRLHGKSEFAGTGIGLAICEKVTANHGGAITAASQPGQGATFSVYLPV